MAVSLSRSGWSALLVLVIAACLFSIVQQLRERHIPVPEDSYQCRNGHAWTEKVSAAPTCPACGAFGAADASYRCPKCSQDFVGLAERREGLGKFSYRLPGATEWLSESPSHFTCPHCEHHAEARFFIGLGYDGQPPSGEGVVD